ncbi:carboxypeptidase-like regulatory domain-containing protein [Pontibacter sp. Tf4]|uniref:carboxypeptidase-like regulatory domain-containing protein n=1 Tax=Pontibacter sp. Tf4 TaxID=2761620 RepID=UPI00162428AF|nr:carboxypeptidase-like regulatory domain-containing protein [Pontibacter sp. Tf4]MBB6613138.1 carboxypeptidase-like regulatory domain-containing protein [Pontibacter sp. Tf4]
MAQVAGNAVFEESRNINQGSIIFYVVLSYIPIVNLRLIKHLAILSFALHRLIGTLLLMLPCVVLYAQAYTIEGTVKSTENGQAIPFVAVSIKNSGTGITADAMGRFKLRLKEHHLTDTLTFSAIGYSNLSLPVKKIINGGLKREVHEVNQNVYNKTFYLSPTPVALGTIEVRAKRVRWKEVKVGYNMSKGAALWHEFEPLDTLLSGVTGQEIGNNFRSGKYPVYLKDFNFGLHGSGNLAVAIRVRIYSIRNSLPHKSLLDRDIVVKIPPHHTGWIKVNLAQYNIKLEEDFAVALEWINEANRLNGNSLMTFAKIPKDQVTFYRDDRTAPWKKLHATSIGMYVSLLYE